MDLVEALKKVQRPEKKATSVYLTSEESEMLDDLANRFNTSRSTILAALIIEGYTEGVN